MIDTIDVQEIDSDNNWTTPLIFYLKNGVLLDGKEVVRKLKVQAKEISRSSKEKSGRAEGQNYPNPQKRERAS